MKLLVTRPATSADPLVDALEARGHEVLRAPLLHIERLLPPDDGLDGAQAVLLTSANAVPGLPLAAKVLPVWAVGEATAAAARAFGCIDVRATGGDGAGLAQAVAAGFDPGGGALVHYCGADVRPGLTEALEQAGFALRRRVVYRAVASERLPDSVATALASGDVDAVLLFSPRTAAILVRLVRGLPAEAGLAAAEAWCLSGAVAQAAAELPWRAKRVASAPTAEALLELLQPSSSA